VAKARRIERLQELILRTAAGFIQREIRDPRVGIVSITRVKLSPDLSHAQLYWSTLGTESSQRTCGRGLKDALPAIQRAVAGAMQTRVTPKLELRFDKSIEQSQRLEEIFRHLREERGEDPEDEDAEDDGGTGDALV
jgi:ribosome-binding factor A